MASQKGTFVRRLVLLAVVVAGLWAPIAIIGIDPRLGLDLQGGISVILQPREADADTASLEKAVDIIQQRVDGLGVAEPDIALQGGNISVQLPGLKNPTEALNVIGTTAKLTFRPVLESLGTTEAPAGCAANDSCKAQVPDCSDTTTFADDVADREVVFCVKGGEDVTGVEIPEDQWLRYLLGPVALQGDDVGSANIDLSAATTGGGFQVNLDLTSSGAKKFEEITGKLACNQGDTRQLAIVLDKVIESAPQVGTDVTCNEGISGGNAVITGSFTEGEARNLALILRYGALPIELEASSTQTISPTLGRESLQDGLLAGLIGVGVVFLYVLFFYRALGVIIWIGIAMHAAITVGVIIILGELAGFALSLAGIAGLIVSLGIASDSFIVYFERIKDEVHQGRAVRGAVERAWPSAWRTILAADLVTALAAVLLYFLAVGSVRGFALTLGLSTALDLIVSRLFMHPSVSLLARTKFLGGSKTLGIGRAVGMRGVAAKGEA